MSKYEVKVDSTNKLTTADIPIEDKLDKNDKAVSSATADKLSTARTIQMTGAVTSDAVAFDGSSNIQLSTSGVDEEYLQWGVRTLTNSASPIDVALVSNFRANRFAFIPPEYVTIEYSRDAGQTWTDYGANNKQKVGLFSGLRQNLIIGKNMQTGVDYKDYQLRVTIRSNGFYFLLRKVIIELSVEGATDCTCTIDARLRRDRNAGNNNWNVFVDSAPISGWSGYNVINGLSLLMSRSNDNQYEEVRFTFKCGGARTNYYGLTIFNIWGLSQVNFASLNNMSTTDHLYTYDWMQNMILPNGLLPKLNLDQSIGSTDKKWLNVYAQNFKGNADTASKATSDKNGNDITTTYATKTELEDALLALGVTMGKGSVSNKSVPTGFSMVKVKCLSGGLLVSCTNDPDEEHTLGLGESVYLPYEDMTSEGDWDGEAQEYRRTELGAIAVTITCGANDEWAIIGG